MVIRQVGSPFVHRSYSGQTVENSQIEETGRRAVGQDTCIYLVPRSKRHTGLSKCKDLRDDRDGGS